MGRRGTSSAAGRIQLADGQVQFCRFEFAKGHDPREIAKQVARTSDEAAIMATLDAVIPLLETSSQPKPYSRFADVGEAHREFIRSRLKRGWSLERLTTLYGFPEGDGDFQKFVRAERGLAEPTIAESNPANPLSLRGNRSVVRPRATVPAPVSSSASRGSLEPGGPQAVRWPAAPARTFNRPPQYTDVRLDELPAPPPAPPNWPLASRGRNAAGHLLDRNNADAIWFSRLEDWEIRALAERFFGTPETRDRQRIKVVYVIAGLKHGTWIAKIADDSVFHNGGTRESVLTLIRFLLGP